jgi:hypothetical protein
MLFPFCPLQASYAVTMTDGVIATELDGGDPRTRLDILGGPRVVNATWVLRKDRFDIWQAYWRQWERSGGMYYEMDLLIDSGDLERYEATFIPGSTNWGSKNGEVFTVTASLWVRQLAKYLDADTDPYLPYLDIIELYNGDIDEMFRVFNLLAKLVNVDLPSEPA